MSQRRTRDTKKKLVYAAEEDMDYGRDFDSIVECQQFVHLVQGVDPIFQGKPWISVKAAHGNAKSSWAVWEDNAITLSEQGMNEQVILHELAHLATDPEVPFHGKDFCWNYLDLTLRWRGVDAYLVLRNALRAEGAL